MSIEAVSWVLRHSEAKLGARLVLIALADHAHPDGSEAYPAVETLARHTRLSRRAVQSALRTLEAEGEIIPDGVGRNGTNCYRLTMGGAKSAPREDDDTGGRSSRREGGEAASPNPSVEPSTKSSKGGNARTREGDDSLPDGFPVELTDHARQVFVVLRSIAERHNAKAVKPRAVGHAMMSEPGRRYVQEAHKLAAWCEGTSKPIKDVVARYQRWLGNADVYAGTEPLGQPIAASAPRASHLKVVGGRERVDWDAVAERLEAEGM
jgi:hypothetical protein